MKRPRCPDCKGEDITFDASAKWNTEKQDFEVTDVHEREEPVYCNDCEECIEVEWIE